MEIIRAEILGFCFGVRRAVEAAYTAIEENKDRKIYSLGPLIHNEFVLNTLSSKGLKIIEEKDIETLDEGSVVVIRAHGVSPDVIEKLKDRKCKIIDATCPRVKSSQKMVSKYTSENDFIFMSGDENHGEVKGISGFAKTNFKLIRNVQEVKELKLDDSEKNNFILLSQTTFSPVAFEEIKNSFKSKVKNLEVLNTICPATKERQDSLLELCKKVDGVIVIGGKNSANTLRLFQTAKENCSYACHIQSAQDIPEEFFSLNKIGITAGASTPDQLISDIENSINSHYN